MKDLLPKDEIVYQWIVNHPKERIVYAVAVVVGVVFVCLLIDWWKTRRR